MFHLCQDEILAIEAFLASAPALGYLYFRLKSRLVAGRTERAVDAGGGSTHGTRSTSSEESSCTHHLDG